MVNINKNRNNFIKLAFFLMIFFLLGLPVLAQEEEIAPDPNVDLEVSIGTTSKVKDLGEYIKVIYEFSLPLIAVIAVVMVIYGGFKWTAALGNSSQIARAKDIINGALIGLVLALGSWLLLFSINPSLVNLERLKIPIVGLKSSFGKFCATTVGEYDEVFDSQTNQQKKAGDYLTCGVKYKFNGGTCIGASCKSSSGQETDYYCSPEITTTEGMRQAIKGEAKYTCLSKERLKQACEDIDDGTADELNLSERQSACDVINDAMSESLKTKGIDISKGLEHSFAFCQWVNNPPIVGGDGCEWCESTDFVSLEGDYESDKKSCTDLGVVPLSGKPAACKIKLCNDLNDCKVVTSSAPSSADSCYSK